MRKGRKTSKSAYDKNFVAVTQKVFAVLEAMSQQRKFGVPLEEITELSGIPKTTVHRLLYSMNKLGYVEQDPVTNLYSLAGKFFELGKNALPYQRLTVVAKPFMQRLLFTFGESINLAVPQGGGVIYILVLESPKAHRLAASVGQLSFLHCTSVGKCVAAYLSREEKEQSLARYGMPAMTSSTITSQEQLEEELARVRTEGVALDNEENSIGAFCVGGPIFASDPQPIAALSVSGPSIRMSQNLPAVRDAVRQATQTISFLLGSGKGRAAQDKSHEPSLILEPPVPNRG
jgi:IclR family transcriptional regulator, KDG regulon repressor